MELQEPRDWAQSRFEPKKTGLRATGSPDKLLTLVKVCLKHRVEPVEEALQESCRTVCCAAVPVLLGKKRSQGCYCAMDKATAAEKN